MAEVRDKGVNFKNPHSLLPTFTMANAPGMAAGHYLGDTGTFSNTIYTGYPSAPAGDTVVPFIENDAVLAMSTSSSAAITSMKRPFWKVARAKVFDGGHRRRSGRRCCSTTPTARPPWLHSIVIDDSTGGKNGVPLSEEMKAALTGRSSARRRIARRQRRGRRCQTPGTLVPNTAQQAYFADVATKVVLPLFKERAKPFVLVFWSRDPDGTQHNTGDSLNTLTPGINGPTSLASIKNADNNLAQLRKALDDLGLSATTNIMIAADHGFSTISKESKTSAAAKASYEDTPKDFLPMGFLAIDLAKA
jgi:predicted AlkP superfamily pyrophosphatase or phosphodiesterase